MWRQFPQPTQNLSPVLIGNPHAPSLLGHPQCSPGSLAKSHISISYVGHKRRLQHLVEPHPPHRSITKSPLEQRIQRRQIQQSLIDVKNTNPLHVAPFGSLSARRFAPCRHAPAYGCRLSARLRLRLAFGRSSRSVTASLETLSSPQRCSVCGGGKAEAPLPKASPEKAKRCRQARA